MIMRVLSMGPAWVVGHDMDVWTQPEGLALPDRCMVAHSRQRASLVWGQHAAVALCPLGHGSEKGYPLHMLIAARSKTVFSNDACIPVDCLVTALLGP